VERVSRRILPDHSGDRQRGDGLPALVTPADCSGCFRRGTGPARGPALLARPVSDTSPIRGTRVGSTGIQRSRNVPKVTFRTGPRSRRHRNCLVGRSDRATRAFGPRFRRVLGHPQVGPRPARGVPRVTTSVHGSSNRTSTSPRAVSRMWTPGGISRRTYGPVPAAPAAEVRSVARNRAGQDEQPTRRVEVTGSPARGRPRAVPPGSEDQTLAPDFDFDCAAPSRPGDKSGAGGGVRTRGAVGAPARSGNGPG